MVDIFQFHSIDDIGVFRAAATPHDDSIVLYCPVCGYSGIDRKHAVEVVCGARGIHDLVVVHPRHRGGLDGCIIRFRPDLGAR